MCCWRFAQGAVHGDRTSRNSQRWMKICHPGQFQSAIGNRSGLTLAAWYLNA